MANRLNGKVAIVTGAASGIGRATAKVLAGEGAKVLLTDIDDKGGAETAQQIDRAGGTATFAPQDVTDEGRWEEIVAEAAERFGPVSVLVNNAGTVIAYPIAEMSYDDWKTVMRVNADSVFLGTRAGIRAMSKTGGGSIVNICSQAGLKGAVNMGAYAASKGAVHLLTKTAALECAYGRTNIRVNSVHPGMIKTAIWEDDQFRARTKKLLEAQSGSTIGDNEHLADVMAGMSVPMGRAADPSEIATAVLFLACDDSSFATGTELIIDGGALA